MTRARKYWLSLGLAAVLSQAAASALLKGYALIAFSDLMMLASVMALFAVLCARVWHSRGNARLFWGLMTLGGGFWLATDVIWVAVRVVLRSHTTSRFFGDSAVFFHFVPMMAALAVQPHVKSDENDLPPNALDLFLLVCWCVYLYVFLVLPWHYVALDPARYRKNFDLLYIGEHLIFLMGLAYLARSTARSWRPVYKKLLLAAGLNAIFSNIVNLAYALPKSSRWSYYSGSFYDVALLASHVIWIYAVLSSTAEDEEGDERADDSYGVWRSRVAGVAVLSLPVFAFFTLIDGGTNEPIKHFRLLVTAIAFFCLTGLVFLKQHLMGTRLIRLLRESHEAYANLQRLQTELIQAEKLVSLGRLVAGAAHEINNPLTAILGYSDLLAGHDDLDPEHREMAHKIRQQARRTKNLVMSLLTFAKPTPLVHRDVDLNSLVGRSLKLRETELSQKQIEVVMQLSSTLPPVCGDESHLLQVCVQLISNAVDAMFDAHGGGALSISTSLENGKASLCFADTGPGVQNPEQVFDPFFTTKTVGKGMGLGLSACYGIIRDHLGEIRCENLPEGGALFSITLPLATKDDVLPARAATILNLPPV